MRLVVVDTSPLRYLVQIDQIETPASIVRDGIHPLGYARRAASPFRAGGGAKPDWLEVSVVGASDARRARGQERYNGLRSDKMNDEVQDLLNAGYKPVVVGPQPFSFEDLLRNVDPAPDEETERFVAAIYADRRQSAEKPSPE